MKPVFAIDPTHDPQSLAAEFRETGRLRIRNFLDGESARFLGDELATSTEWRRVINGTNQVFEISRADFAALAPQHREQIDKAVRASAARGFQYCYETIRISEHRDERRNSARLIDAFLDFMNEASTMSFFNQILGGPTATLIDGQATAYGPGDFLTRHDDNVAGKNRVAAYVLSLVEGWQPGWGGALGFESQTAQPDIWFPEFNALAFFSVPQPHRVHPVALATPVLRTSITGWLREV